MAEKKQNFWWPDVSTRESAEAACKQGAGVSFFVAGVTALFAILGLSGIEFAQKMGMNGWALIDAFIFLAVGFGIMRHSRVAAVIGTALFVIAKALTMAQAPAGIVMGLIFTLAFIGAIRGTFSLAKLAPATATGVDHDSRERKPIGVDDAKPLPDNAYAPPGDK